MLEARAFSQRCFRRKSGLALVFATALVGCAPEKVNLQSEADPAGSSYARTLERWTRTGRILSKTEFHAELLVSGTLRSRAFQRAFVEKYVKTYAVVDPWERSRIEKEQAEQTQGGVSLFLLTRTHTANWNELRPSFGKWRLSLLDDAGREVQADKVEPFAQKQAVEMALLDQQNDPFAKLWSVHFPEKASDGQLFPKPTTETLRLRVAGPLGLAELVWFFQ
jgi:hypothetical protein